MKISWKKILFLFLVLFLVFSTGYVISVVTLFNNIETLMRILGCIMLVDIVLLLFTILNKFKKKTKIKAFIITSVIILIYTVGITFVGYKVKYAYSKLAEVTNNSKTAIYSASVITLKNNPAKKISDLGTGTVGIITDKEDYEGYTIGHEIIDENKIASKYLVKYDDYVDILQDLIDKKIDFAIVPTNYEQRYSTTTGLENIGQITKIIHTKEEEKKKDVEVKEEEVKTLDKPFTVLVMGVDTVNDGFSAGFNGDALILVTFNPKTTNATILSIPRDTYIPISCMGNRKNKITNAGWRGEKCIINSLSNYLGVKIDYHVKINFNGVVQLVDKLGGVEVDVPYAFCEQNSKRKWGKNTVFVKAGKQTLNGEQALAFARHRKVTSYMVSYCGKTYTQNAGYWNDFTRGQNQQIIISAMIKKFKNIKSYSEVESIINTVSKNVETDISTDNILSLYNLGKDVLKRSASQDEVFGMQKLYLQGHDAMIYDYSYINNAGSKLTLYNYVIYKESLDAVVKAMKENLDLVSMKPVKKFSYSITEKVTDNVIGKGIGSTSTLKLLPNFVGRNVSYAESIASSYGINIDINYVDGKKGQFVGQILSQTVPAKTDIDMLGNYPVVLNVVGQIINNNPEPDPEPEPDPSSNSNSNSNTNPDPDPGPDTSNQE